MKMKAGEILLFNLRAEVKSCIFLQTAVWTDCALVHSALMVDLLSFLHSVTTRSWAIEVTHEVVHPPGGRLSPPGGRGLCLSHLRITIAQLHTEQALNKREGNKPN